MIKEKNIFKRFGHGLNGLNSRSRKTVKLQFKKRPVISIAGLFFVIVILCGGSYQLYKATGLLSLNAGNPNVETKVKDINPKTNDKIAAIAIDSPAKPEEEPKVDPHRPASTTKYSTSCKGVGCATANPTYSIITTKSITVTVGTYVGPFAASTSNNSNASWSTPQYNGNGIGPSGYTLAPTQNGASIQYYVRADQTVTPGIYTLYMSATQSSTQALVRTSLSVTVLPAPTPSPESTPTPTPPLPY